MARAIHVFRSPDRFVAGTVGQPGNRTFYLQAVHEQLLQFVVQFQRFQQQFRFVVVEQFEPVCQCLVEQRMLVVFRRALVVRQRTVLEQRPIVE